MLVFLHANMLFSAAWKDDSDSALLFDLTGAQFCELITSRLAVEEARRNMAYKRPARQLALERLVVQTRVGNEPAETYLTAAREHGLPDKDMPILAAAMTQRADLLVTGDRRDFGHLYGSSPGEVQVINLVWAIKRLLTAPE